MLKRLKAVTIALERGCVRPRVRTRWQHLHRKYEWPDLFASDLFVMDSPLPVLHDSYTMHHQKINGGPWPHQYYNASEAAAARAREDR